MSYYKPKKFEESEETKGLYGDWQNYVKNAPTYSSQYGGAIKDTMDKILNREKFTYDVNGDALYQQYKDKYIQQGKMAMQDTMGQASAMTGGYGNSYAATVGNQAYQASLQNLNDVVPELYSLAYSKYAQEGQDLKDQYSMLADRENADYQRFSDYAKRYDEGADYYRQAYEDSLSNDLLKYEEGEAARKATLDAIEAGDIEAAADRELKTGLDDESVAYWANKFQNAEAFGSGEDIDTIKREMTTVYGYNADQVLKIYEAAMTPSEEEEEEEPFHKAIFSRIDDNGNYVFYRDGKEQTFSAGVNPYIGTTNPDIKYGAFSNGYQPNNINGQKLSKTGITDVINGVTQNVWKTPDGKMWIWDETQNQYLSYVE